MQDLTHRFNIIIVPCPHDNQFFLLKIQIINQMRGVAPNVCNKGITSSVSFFSFEEYSKVEFGM